MKSIKLILLSAAVAAMLASCGMNDGTVATPIPHATASPKATAAVTSDTSAGGAVKDAGDAAGDAVKDVGDAAGDAVEGVGDAAGDIVTDAGDAAGVNDANSNGK